MIPFNVANFTFYLMITLALFGPKIGWMDTSVLAGFIGIFGVPSFIKTGSLRISKSILWFFVLMVIILFYSLYICLISNSNFYSFFRSARATISLALLGVVIYNYRLKLSNMIDLILIVLLLNAIAIFSQIFFPETKLYFAELYQFNKHFVSLRSFGLTAGYDTAGFFCIMGFILSALLALDKRKKLKYILFCAIFCFATFFTSRSSMILISIFAFVFYIWFLLKGNYTLRIFSIIMLCFFAIIFYYYVFPLLKTTIIFFNFIRSTGIKPPDLYVHSFAITNLTEWRTSFFILPHNFSELFFGTGIDPASDIGYVKLLFMVGIIGTCLILTFYFLLLLSLYFNLKNHSLFGLFNRDGLILTNALFIIIPMQFIFNIKNLYFLTRGYFELIIILFILWLVYKKRIKQVLLKIHTPN